jgi:hypothetical protein
MLVCDTCGSRWDEHAPPATTFVSADCPLCGGELRLSDAAVHGDREPVHADVASVLRDHLLGVGA